MHETSWHLRHSATKSAYEIFKRACKNVMGLFEEGYGITGKSALCVGCRNRDEIIYFRKKGASCKKGASNVIGIDLSSDRPEIRVVEMHALKFPDETFDIVYNRHWFAHAFDKRKAAQEFVPVFRTQRRGRHRGPWNVHGARGRQPV